MSLLLWPDAVDSLLLFEMGFKFPAEDESRWLSTVATVLQGMGSLLDGAVAKIILSKVSTRWKRFSQ